MCCSSTEPDISVSPDGGTDVYFPVEQGTDLNVGLSTALIALDQWGSGQYVRNCKGKTTPSVTFAYNVCEDGSIGQRIIDLSLRNEVMSLYWRIRFRTGDGFKEYLVKAFVQEYTEAEQPNSPRVCNITLGIEDFVISEQIVA